VADGRTASGEDALIARYFKPIATEPGAFGLQDDAAILRADGEDVVVTTDAVVEGVHFLPEDPPQTLALRAVDDAWLTAFARGLGEDARHYACPLLGGDTVSTPGPLTVSITAFGRVPRGRMVRRSGARPGDRVMVTGTIGDAAIGLNILKGGAAAAALSGNATARDWLVGRYRLPEPRNALAGAIRDHASAAMDVSDGLAGDLAKLCAASGVSAVIDVPSIPKSAAAADLLAGGVVRLEAMICGGDDYEVLCAVPEAACPALGDEATKTGVALTSIGTVVAPSEPLRFLDAQGRDIALDRLSYSHF
jgi:thiamine-monophosphate kinase